MSISSLILIHSFYITFYSLLYSWIDRARNLSEREIAHTFFITFFADISITCFSNNIRYFVLI